MNPTKEFEEIKPRGQTPKGFGKLPAARRAEGKLPQARRKAKPIKPAPALPVLEALSESEVDFTKLAAQIAAKPERVEELFTGLLEQKADYKYGCLKLLRLLSEKWPAIIYPHFDRFVALMESDVTFTKWGSIIILGNLAAVDVQNKIEGILEKYLAPINGRVMITAANVIGGAGRIARAKRRLAGRIARAVLQVEKAQFATIECRQVAVGHAIKSLDLFYDWIPERQAVVDFIRRQLQNPRPATRAKAAKFLREHMLGA